MAALTRPGLLERGRQGAEEFIRHGVDTWEAEGHIDSQRARALMTTLNAPEVEGAMFHLGAHFAISLPLRFPFGALARFFYTLGLRIRAELNAIMRRGSARDARRMHNVLVMLVSLLPGFGRLGYFFSPALRDERLLLVIPIDQASRRLPFQAYSRLHLDALILYWGLGDAEPDSPAKPKPGGPGPVGRWAAAVRPHLKLTAALLTINGVLLLVGAYMYLEQGRPEEPLWWWQEGGLIAIADTSQLLLGAVFGIAAYTAFWKRPGTTSRSEAAGIFFWPVGALGLITFALDDFFTVHERVGDWVFDQLSFVPVVTTLPSDMLVIGYAVAGLSFVALFRRELMSGRASALLLLLGAASAVVMVLADGFATTDELKALEFPAQTFACSFFLLAFYARWSEVRQLQPSPPASTLQEAGSR